MVSDIKYYTGSEWVSVMGPTGPTGPAGADGADGSGGASTWNRVVNGNFAVWQRGTGAFTTAGYTADQWAIRASGSTFSASKSSFALGNAITGYEPDSYYTVAVTSSAGSGNYVQLQQRIENVRTFAGQTATVSFWAKANATKDIAVELMQNFGTGGSSSVTGTGQKTTISTTWTRYDFTFSVPSISGKTLGVDANGYEDHYLALNIWLDAGSNFDTRSGSLGQQSGTFDFWGVQFEPGDTATTFDPESMAVNLNRCRRYFVRYTNPDIKQGICYTTTGVTMYATFPVDLRAKPTSTLPSSGSVDMYGSGTKTSATAVGPEGVNERGSFIVSNGYSGLTVGRPVRWNGGDNWDWSAEL